MTKPACKFGPALLLGFSGGHFLLACGTLWTLNTIRKDVERYDISGGAAFGISLPLLGLLFLTVVCGLIPAMMLVFRILNERRSSAIILLSGLFLLPWSYMAMRIAIGAFGLLFTLMTES